MVEPAARAKATFSWTGDRAGAEFEAAVDDIFDDDVTMRVDGMLGAAG